MRLAYRKSLKDQPLDASRANCGAQLFSNQVRALFYVSKRLTKKIYTLKSLILAITSMMKDLLMIQFFLFAVWGESSWSCDIFP